MHALRRLGLEGTELARAQCGTIREKVLKIGAPDSGERSQGVAVDVGELSAGGGVQGGVGATRGDTDSQLAYDLRHWAGRVTGGSSRVARRALHWVARRDGPSATLEIELQWPARDGKSPWAARFKVERGLFRPSEQSLTPLAPKTSVQCPLGEKSGLVDYRSKILAARDDRSAIEW